MVDIVATDVTYTLIEEHRLHGIGNKNVVKLEFGDGALTYPAGGIPITIGNLGCPVNIESFKVVDQGTSGYKFQYDQSTAKLVIMQAPAAPHNHDLHLNEGDVADGATTRVNAATNLLGANSGADILIAGVADATGPGGILTDAGAAAALSQASTVAIAAQTIEVEVTGW